VAVREFGIRNPNPRTYEYREMTMKELQLISEDRRRGRVRSTRLALVGGGVILVLAVVLIAFGIRRIQAGGQMRPVVTPTAATAIRLPRMPRRRRNRLLHREAVPPTVVNGACCHTTFPATTLRSTPLTRPA